MLRASRGKNTEVTEKRRKEKRRKEKKKAGETSCRTGRPQASRGGLQGGKTSSLKG